MSDRRIIPLLIVLAFIGLFACVIVAYLLLQSDSEPEPTVTPSAEPVVQATPAPTVTPTLVPENLDSWGRVQQSGKMVVGTAADYPPFEYYTSDFQLDGFDMALIREIGQRLGVNVEIIDMAFDGLSGALQVGQIDLAIAALSITPERGQIVDFTNIYFVTEDAILTTSQQQVAVKNAEDLGGFRIGVQNASVHEDWVQRELVSGGLIDQSNMFLYREIDQAATDLAAGRIDFVVVDLPPAQAVARDAAFAIAGQGLNRQRFGIAVPKGSDSLQAKLNQALGEMQVEGRVDALAEVYIGLDKDQVIPIPTREPTPTPQPTEEAPACVDGMQRVADLTFDDQNLTNPPSLPPGQPFIKSWRVRNTGTCTWDASYALVYETGNVAAARMGGQPSIVDRRVRPGEEYDFSVNLVAPLLPGTYQAFWTMRNGQGQLFGDRLVVAITVPAPATPTPAPTQTPVPGITFTVDRTQIRQGECVVFSWDVQNAQAVYIHADGEPWDPNRVAGQGSRQVCPATTTTYNLRVVYPSGTIEIRQITISVEPVAGAPTISQFSVNPPFQVYAGQTVELQWSVSGTVNSVTILRNGAALWADAPWSGRIQDSPPGSGEFVYAVEASGSGGTSRQQHVLTVIEPATPLPPATPTVPAAPPPPVINAFVVSPNVVQPGQCFKLSWTTSGGTTLVQIKRDGVVVLDNASLVGTAQDCLANIGTVVYRLEAGNSSGQTDFREEPVSVVAAGAGRPQLASAAVVDSTGIQIAAAEVFRQPALEYVGQ